MVQSLMSWYHPTSCIIACRVALPDDHGKSRTKTGFRSRSSTKSNRLSPYQGQPIPKISIESVLNFVTHTVWHMYRLCPDSTHLPRFVHSRIKLPTECILWFVDNTDFWPHMFLYLVHTYATLISTIYYYYYYYYTCCTIIHTYMHAYKFIQRQNCGNESEALAQGD